MNKCVAIICPIRSSHTRATNQPIAIASIPGRPHLPSAGIMSKAGLRVNMPSHSNVAPFKPSNTGNPRSAPVAKKRKPDSSASTTTAKRAHPLAGSSRFLNPFPSTSPAEPPNAFDPGISVAESEELTRQLQLRHRHRTPDTRDEDEPDRDMDGIIDDIDTLIDPSLCNEGK